MGAMRKLLLCVAVCTTVVGCGPVEEGKAEPQHLVTQVSALYTEGVKNEWPSYHSGECLEWREPQGCSGPIWPDYSGGNLDDCNGQCNPFQYCLPHPNYAGAMRCCNTKSECVRRATWTCTHYDGACSTNPLWPYSYWYFPQRVFVEGVGEQSTTGRNQFPWIVVCTNGQKSKGNGFCMM